jgi:AcrR family transcriptional regulator
MSERKQQILQAAINIIVEQGYGALTMRALARADGIKLGALQYHFKTKDDMLRALVSYLADEYQKVFKAMGTDLDSVSIKGLVGMIGMDPAGGALQFDKLAPQLWAMGQVEPLVADLVEDFYDQYLQVLEKKIEAAGGESPRAEAICIMSMMEGSILFLSEGKRWSADKDAVIETLLGFINAKYGEKA